MRLSSLHTCGGKWSVNHASLASRTSRQSRLSSLMPRSPRIEASHLGGVDTLDAVELERAVVIRAVVLLGDAHDVDALRQRGPGANSKRQHEQHVGRCLDASIHFHSPSGLEHTAVCYLVNTL